MPETSRYTPELAAEICRRMSEGEPLRQICRDLDMPPESTVRSWARNNTGGFAADYHEARQLQVHAWADEIVLLANRDDLDPQDKRVRIDTLKWLCSKLIPQRYGERLLMSGDPEMPIQHLHHDVSALLDQLSPQQLDDLVRFSQSLTDAGHGTER
jgi:hypothetical protein